MFPTAIVNFGENNNVFSDLSNTLENTQNIFKRPSKYFIGPVLHVRAKRSKYF